MPLGWSDRCLALLNALDLPGALPARVVRVERSRCVVACADGAERRVVPRDRPAVGDWLALADEQVLGALPRWSALSRRDPDGVSVQVMAANIDLVVITAPADRLSPARVERELVAAWDSGAQPVVVLTKADLTSGGEAEALGARLAGVEVIATSVHTGEGLATLRDALRPNRTAVLLGPSGAGKSTLANALLGEEVLATGAVREGDQRGRHTTTARRLVPVPSGGVLIDTPGLRSLSLAGAGGGMDRAFSDIDDLAAACRFDDCRHDAEPGCAVIAAAASGELGRERLEHFRKLERELAAEERRRDPLLRKAELSVWKAVAKSAKVQGRNKRR